MPTSLVTPRPAITRRSTATGTATHVSTRLGPHGLQPVLEELLGAAGLCSELPTDLRGRVELAVRGGDDADFWFLINRTDQPVDITSIDGDLSVNTGEDAKTRGPNGLAPRGVAVVKTTP